ncbi:hypothetical protein GCM10010211_17440 [Streptomyces albospinus]|uniref:Uncharacterized protein n=1 Tax=Streptomyces albospinus TaxID=285515 RepID=A0ABQ2UV47_9ACTN|nr:hypothetical protein [Streptomyces albospinus]GGU53266.1 hypothetical protein GCM10010211_17440 [Streptomyces albospinus]
MNHSKKTVSRIFTVSAALGIALAAGSATATSAIAATPLASHVAVKAPAAQARAADGHGRHHGGGEGDEGDCKGLIVLLCA